MRIHILTFIFYFSFLPISSAEGIQVMIDPGHGGSDHGAKSGHLREADIALNISKLIEGKIKNSNLSLTPLLTRKDDVDVTLSQRVAAAKKNNSDIFISVHVNSSLDPSAKGSEFYFTDGSSKHQWNLDFFPSTNSSKEEKLVTKILQDLNQQQQFFSSHSLSMSFAEGWQSPQKRKQAIKQAPFYVINQTQIPSILIEVGFISNPTEARRLGKLENQELLAEQIFQGLLKYKEKMDRNQATHLE